MKRVVSNMLLLCLAGIAYGQGTVVQKSFHSDALNATRKIAVYLPAGYNHADPSKKYPVIYFLPGAVLEWSLYADGAPIVFDALISRGAIQPMIAVIPDGTPPPLLPNGTPSPFVTTFYTNSELYGAFEDYIVVDLIKHIDQNYNTIPAPESRAIIGHSTGGFGAMKLALKHPDVFRTVASLSGPLGLVQVKTLIPKVLSENGGSKPYSFSPNAGLFSSLAFAMAGAFSPNLSNPPYFVDFPLDKDGNLIETVFAKWLLHNPAVLAKRVSTQTKLAIYFDCAEQDEFLLYPFNTAFADSLNKLGLNYSFQHYPGGGHADPIKIIGRASTALLFINGIMTEVAFDEPRYLPETTVLHQNYPNPFNPTTTIQFFLPRSENVSLKIYNTFGQELETLVSEKLPRGNFKYEWNAGGLTSGIYFYRLQAGSFVQVRKLVLVK